MLFASIPAAFALAVSLAEARRQSLWRNVITLLVLALSCWVGLNGAVFGTANLEVCRADGYSLESLMWYAPEFSVLWRPLVTMDGLPMWQWPRAAAFALGFAHLAAPLVMGIYRQASVRFHDLWQALRVKGPWRF